MFEKNQLDLGYIVLEKIYLHYILAYSLISTYSLIIVVIYMSILA